jgi:hypothetical protein
VSTLAVALTNPIFATFLSCGLKADKIVTTFSGTESDFVGATVTVVSFNNSFRFNLSIFACLVLIDTVFFFFF